MRGSDVCGTVGELGLGAVNHEKRLPFWEWAWAVEGREGVWRGVLFWEWVVVRDGVPLKVGLYSGMSSGSERSSS